MLFSTGNPGLGNMELSLADFDCDSPVPSFITPDKWEDLMAISVLPGPLDGLCVQFAQRTSEWEAWYKSLKPEDEPLPYRPATSGEGESGKICDYSRYSCPHVTHVTVTHTHVTVTHVTVTTRYSCLHITRNTATHVKECVTRVKNKY